MRKTQQPLTHFTAAVFEAFNLDIQRNVDPHHTSGFNEGMVTRHILRSATRHYINEYDGSATFRCWWQNQQKEPSNWAVLPQTQFHKVKETVAGLTSKYPQLENVIILKSIRIVADIVQVTDSPYYVKLRHGHSWCVVKPAFAFLFNNKPYLYGFNVHVSNPFANLRLQNDDTLDFLEKIKHFPKFCYILETDELEPADDEHHVYDCDNIVAYLFPLKLSNIDYLIEGTERVARL
uniref:DNA primase small subunit n=1 Tax=Panagrellus redivivus TaxID=6233 RepID=A0A7E5A1W3_PANRE